MRIALASPPFPASLSDALYWVEALIKDASTKKAEIICFPESYVPGYPGLEFTPQRCSAEELKGALDKISRLASENSIAVIIPMDWYHEGTIFNIAHVISADGEVVGYQTKNQLDPSEDSIWVPGTERTLFEVNGLKFGIVICHEGFRYPETVRWAAMRGAKIVFHPHLTGSNIEGPVLTEWGHKDNPYYEKAAMVRALENTIYFASINYALKYQESGTSLIRPDGTCVANQVYGESGVLVAEINRDLATGLLAKRFKPGLLS